LFCNQNQPYFWLFFQNTATLNFSTETTFARLDKGHLTQFAKNDKNDVTNLVKTTLEE